MRYDDFGNAPIYVGQVSDFPIGSTNTGSRHIQLRTVDVLHDGPGVDARHVGPWYVLPGQRRSVTIAPLPGRTIATDRVRIHADTDAGIVAADVVLDPR